MLMMGPYVASSDLLSQHQQQPSVWVDGVDGVDDPHHRTGGNGGSGGGGRGHNKGALLPQSASALAAALRVDGWDDNRRGAHTQMQSLDGFEEEFDS